MPRVICVGVLLVCCVTSCLAHDSEPINTEFASPLERGAGNVNFAAQYLRNGGGYDAAGVELEYGFAPRMQFSAGLPLTHFAGSAGRGNLEFAARFLVAGKNSARYAVSINPLLELPTHAGRFGDDGYRAGGAVHLDTHPSERFWTHTNLGYTTPVAGFAFKDKTFFYRVAGMYELTERVQPVLELLGEHDYASGAGLLAIEPEIILGASHHWEIKAGVPVGLTRATPAVGAQFEITWKFGHVGRQ